MSEESKIGRALQLFIRPGRTRQAAEEDARHLIEAYQHGAYREARRRAREARNERWSEGERHWSRVARAIARHEGREIGLQTADRYER